MTLVTLLTEEFIIPSVTTEDRPDKLREGHKRVKSVPRGDTLHTFSAVSSRLHLNIENAGRSRRPAHDARRTAIAKPPSFSTGARQKSSGSTEPEAKRKGQAKPMSCHATTAKSSRSRTEAPTKKELNWSMTSLISACHA